MDRQSLDGAWWLLEFERGEGEAEGAFALDFPLPPNRTLPAQVPGVVHLDLLRAGKIPDPFYRLNENAVRWVEEREWWYRCQFTVNAQLLRRQAVELTFHGLDTFATVWLNGEKLGETDNMFIPHRFAVKNFLRERRNVLAVRFDSPTKVAEERQQQHGKLWSAFYDARPHLRKAQYSFGWDWGPRLPTVGIWRSVELWGYDFACIRNLWAFVTELSEDRKVAKVRVEGELHAVAEGEATMRFTLQHGEQQIAACVPATLQQGDQILGADLTVTNPKLWFPVGMGEQPLYNLTCQVEVGNKVTGKKTVRVGLRQVELVREKDDEGETFIVRINGVPVFCKGANWIPADNFLPRVTKERYRNLLQKAADANMNMLRIWGGGIYEDEGFYEACDELGIMVWQDFMFACAEYPEGEWFYGKVRSEAEKVIKGLLHHPSIVVWCGNNENDWGYHAGWFGKRNRFYGETLYAQILPEVCRRLDPSRPYWQSSPFGGADPNSVGEGDRHSWDVWSGWRDYTHYLHDTGRFISEFGFQAPPHLLTIETFTEPQDRYPNSAVMEHHNKQGEGTERLYRFMAGHFRVPDDFAQWVRVAQLVQGEALKTGIVHWRRRKFKTAGALFWQLNDCWPVVSWSVLDYFGRPKAGYYYAKRSFAPVLVSVAMDGETPVVWVVNDTLTEVNGTLVVKVQDLWGGMLHERLEVVTMEPNTSQRLDAVPLPDGFDPHRHFISAEFYVVIGEITEPLSYDALFLVPYKHLTFPSDVVGMEAVEVKGDQGKVRLKAKAFAKGVWLEVDGDPDAFWSDNAFDFLPGMTRTVAAQLSRPMTEAELRRRLLIWHLGLT